MAIDVKPDPTSKTFRKKSPSSLMCSPKKRGGRAMVNNARTGKESQFPEQTEAGRLHAALWKAWIKRMDRETFVAFMSSPYC